MQADSKEGYSCNTFFLLSAYNKNVLQEMKISNFLIKVALKASSMPYSP